MIAKMKKLLLFMANTGTPVDAQLAELGRLGLVHIVPFQPPRNQSIELISSQLQRSPKPWRCWSVFPQSRPLR